MSPPAKTPSQILISAEQLAARLDAPDLLLVDTRFKLEDTAYGRAAYDSGHIPGAVYMDLDRDLSSPIVPGETGRHPLPDPAVLEARLREIGLRKADQVIIYDDGPGVYPSRLWWLLNWLGHTNVLVLDGGLAAWKTAGLALSADVRVRPWPSDFVACPDNSLLVLARDLLQGDAGLQLLDARAPERFRGEIEPIDPVAGHIPGARCFPFGANLGADGLWLTADLLRARFPLLEPGQLRVCYCGSGVTACHNILAAVLAGLPMPKLYAGSWSEWIVDPSRPVATGD
ncbi:MAG: sulfurtransferase [Pseudohongiella sp.]|nr:sulfurtransferase [Pseudohongiella sp.]